MNRHERRKQESALRKIQKPLKKAAQFDPARMEYQVQRILRRAAPVRFWLMDRFRKRWLLDLLGFRVGHDLKSLRYDVFLGGKVVGSFGALNVDHPRRGEN